MRRMSPRSGAYVATPYHIPNTWFLLGLANNFQFLIWIIVRPEVKASANACLVFETPGVCVNNVYQPRLCSTITGWSVELLN